MNQVAVVINRKEKISQDYKTILEINGYTVIVSDQPRDAKKLVDENLQNGNKVLLLADCAKGFSDLEFCIDKTFRNYPKDQLDIVVTFGYHATYCSDKKISKQTHLKAYDQPKSYLCNWLMGIINSQN
jgi:hypothetical protein